MVMLCYYFKHLGVTNKCGKYSVTPVFVCVCVCVRFIVEVKLGFEAT